MPGRFFTPTLAPALALLLVSSGGLAETQSKDILAEDEGTGYSLFDCGELTWLNDCERVNRHFKEHPQAPLRVIDRNGVEHNFAPDTPSALIRLTVLQTREAAKDYYDYVEQVFETDQRVTELIREEARRRGVEAAPVGHLAKSLDGTAAAATAALGEPPDLRYDALRVYVFTDSTCSACSQQYEALEVLKERHPDLEVQILQLNDDRSAVDRLENDYGFTANIIPRGQRSRYQSLLEVTPTIWIDDSRTRQRVIRQGVQDVASLEAAMQEVMQ